MPGGALESEEGSSIFVGPKLDEHRGAFYVEYPMENGSVNDNAWDAMERLWEVSLCFFFFIETIISYEHLSLSKPPLTFRSVRPPWYICC